MKSLSRIHILLAVLALLLGTTLRGQNVPEMVPYMLQPMDYDPDCRLELNIALLHPYTIQSMTYNIQKDETLEVIYERINFETIYPDHIGEVFSVDDKLYVLVRIPHTGASWDYNRGWE